MGHFSPVVICVRCAGEAWRVSVAEVGLQTEFRCESEAVEAASWIARAFWLATDRGCMVVLEKAGLANRTLAHYQMANDGVVSLVS